MTSIATFSAPPVSELALGIQFDPIEQLSPVYASIYWHEVLGRAWPGIHVEQPMGVQQEVLGPTGIWKRNVFSVREQYDAPRLQFTDESDEKMLQIENCWYVFNWRKRDGRYPTYERLSGEFHSHFASFVDFIRRYGLGEIRPSLWEVTYINKIPKGSIWNQVTDWDKVFPGLFASASERSLGDLESYNANWIFRLKDGSGRLRVHLRHVRHRAGDNEEEAIDFRLSARGILDSAEPNEIGKAFDIGHEAVVVAFLEMTSKDAQHAWGRTA